MLNKEIQAHESEKENILMKVTSSIFLRFLTLRPLKKLQPRHKLCLCFVFFYCTPSNSPFKMIFIHHQPKLFSVISMQSAVSRNRDLSSVELLLLCYCFTTAVLWKCESIDNKLALKTIFLFIFFSTEELI